MQLLRRYIGTRDFYKNLLAVAIPIVVQNGITNFINLLDNVMVGRIGTEQMSGVSIVNQLLFIFYLCIFGALSGVGLFSAQFYGKQDHEGIRHTFRFKMMLSLALCGVAILIYLFAADPLIRMYLHEGSETGDLELTYRYAKEYLGVSLWGLLPYTLAQVYSSTLREIGKTLPPMYAGLAGITLNLALNYVLIYGAFGVPALGVRGAAIATVIARITECVAILIWTHAHTQKCQFIKGAYRSLYVPMPLVRNILRTGTPLLLNETVWAAGQAMLLQCYSVRGIASVSAMNISSTVFNTFSVIYLAVGTSVSILIGHRLGAADNEGAMEDSRRMIAFAGMMGLLAGILIALCAPFFPYLYNTTDEVRSMATALILVIGIYSPVHGVLNSSYFTLRSGGKTVLTFFFDSGYVWGVNIPVVLLLTHFSSLSTAMIFLICHGTELIKCIIGTVLVKKGVWLHDITQSQQPQEG